MTQALIASYRGPADAGIWDSSAPKAAGGLIQALQPWVEAHNAWWVFAAGEGSIAREANEARVPVEIGGKLRHGHYEVISNSILWPLFHGIDDWATDQLRGHVAADEAWACYKAVNRLFGERILACAPTGSTVVAHDYQLLLLPGILRQARPDLDLIYFHHIPFASHAEFRALPKPWRQEVAESLSGCRCGFQSARWERRFVDFCVAEGACEPRTFLAPVGPDLAGLAREAESEEVVQLRHTLRKRVGQRKLIARVDRADPMKNVLGGLQAVDLLLAEDPRWCGEFVFVHHLVPTRTTINSYKRHLADIMESIEAVNKRWHDNEWQPIDANVADQRAYGLALLVEYDILLVNPLREGMNLVAHEGPALNRQDGILVLSEEAGAYDALAPAALGVDPSAPLYTAAELGRALAMPAEERVDRAKRLRSTVASLGVDSWHDVVLRAGRTSKPASIS